MRATAFHMLRFILRPAPLCFISLFYLFTLSSQIVFASKEPTNLLIGQVQVFENPSATATIAEIQTRDTQFIDLHTSVPYYGYTTSAYWLRMPVQNIRSEAATFYLDIKNPLLEYVDLYVVSETGIRSKQESGTAVPARMRPYFATTFVFPFELAANETAELYTRIHSDNVTLQIPYTIIDEADIQPSVAFSWILSTVLLCTLASMFFYNFFLLTLLRNRLYLYYVLYLFFSSIAVGTLGGIGPAYLYPDYQWLNNQGILFATPIAFALMILIVYEFLLLPSNRVLNRLAIILVLWALVFSAGTFFWPARFSYQILLSMNFVYPTFCFFAGIRALRHGIREARFFMIGQISSWTGLFITGFMATNILPYHPFIFQSAAIGAVIDALLLSLALADRIRILQSDRLAAQRAAQRNLEIRREELERLVIERTAEIKRLHGILPICANCKKIRTDDGAWQQLEEYISQHTDAEFSHGICTDCKEELYGEYYRKQQFLTYTK